jgi:hypothetical protein
MTPARLTLPEYLSLDMTVFAQSGLQYRKPVRSAPHSGLIAADRPHHQRSFSALVLVDARAGKPPAPSAFMPSLMSAHPDGFDSFEHASAR